MQTAIECIPCFVRQAAEAIALSERDPFQQERILRKVMHALADHDWLVCPPVVAEELHRLIREMAGHPNPYCAIRERMNRFALDCLPACRELIANARDPREAVVRLAVAGNRLDSGAKIRIEPESLPDVLASLWEQPLAGDPNELFRAAHQAQRILYIADNAGEIVLDRLLIEALPVDNITVAVRGGPILNDALYEDARRAGITALVPVIDSGSEAPGTVLEDCSAEFRADFKRADLIIAKGQGNYETLADARAPIFFLFTVKCPLVARQIGEPVGTMVARKSTRWSARQA